VTAFERFADRTLSGLVAEAASDAIKNVCEWLSG
jgi:hypothetical protein